MSRFSTVTIQSTAERIADVLRERILDIEVGAYLGSESTIAETIGVSLPTLRQATRLLEYEQLLRVKPGKNGGYYTRRPDIDSAVRSAAQFLVGKKISHDDYNDAVDCILVPLLTNAVACDDENLRNKLAAHIEEQAGIKASEISLKDGRRYGREFLLILAEMSGNIILELFTRIIVNEISNSRLFAQLSDSPRIMNKTRKLRVEVAKAVLAKDLNKALESAEKRSSFMRKWPISNKKSN